MQTPFRESRLMWLTAGLLAGLCISYFWPHEPVAAASNDRNSKFGIMTTPVALNAEGVFVLDFLTGRLTGAVMDPRVGTFTVKYFRNVSADFNVNPKSTPRYAFVGGRARIASRGQVTPAESVIYVAELSSGLVIAYGMHYVIPRGKVLVPQPLAKLDAFPFREATQP